MIIPHHFPSLIDGPRQVIIIAGTGLSFPNAPTTEDLLPKLKTMTAALHIPPVDDFYKLADALLKNRVANGMAEAESRLWLATELGMLDDRRWFGDIGLPLSGNTPRHRAIARFAVEGRLRAIVSLNWDALLEVALESVGLMEKVNPHRPWQISSYARVVDDTHMPKLATTLVFPIIKPHGCVRECKQARAKFRSTGTIPRFTLKLTETDLSRPGSCNLVDRKVECYLSECPLIAIGWRASEPNLRKIIVDTARAVKRTEPDAFALIARSWYPNENKNDPNHWEIADGYGTNQVCSHFKVPDTDCPNMDYFFQWLQARYALTKMIGAANPTQQEFLKAQLRVLDKPSLDVRILEWVDCWLYIWVRLCWRTGVMHGIDPNTNREIKPCEIPVTPRDVHIPLSGMSNVRRDLQAAVRLLVELGDSLSKFKYDVFPGGLWDPPTRLLYLPLPGWRGIGSTYDLAALKPLVDALKGKGFVRELRLVWLDTENTAPDRAHQLQLEAQVKSLMPFTRLASGDAISWVDLTDLKGE